MALIPISRYAEIIKIHRDFFSQMYRHFLSNHSVYADTSAQKEVLRTSGDGGVGESATGDSLSSLGVK